MLLGSPQRWTFLGIALLATAALGVTVDDQGAGTREPSSTPNEGSSVGRQGGAPEDPLAAALATALEAVHDRYAPGAKPVPADVEERLAAEYPDELARARYVVSELAIRLLTAIDRFQGTSLRQGLHAVTVDDLIIFSSAPKPSDLWMWAHELHHVRQYQTLGSIHAFAGAYLEDCEAIEKSADERANRALGAHITLSHCLQ